jgi:hypothetical protein
MQWHDAVFLTVLPHQKWLTCAMKQTMLPLAAVREAAHLVPIAGLWVFLTSVTSVEPCFHAWSTSLTLLPPSCLLLLPLLHAAGREKMVKLQPKQPTLVF